MTEMMRSRAADIAGGPPLLVAGSSVFANMPSTTSSLSGMKDGPAVPPQQPHAHLIDQLERDLRSGAVIGAYPTAVKTLQYLRTLVSSIRWNSQPTKLLEAVQDVGNRLMRAAPTEFSARNMVRRVLHIVRQNYREHPPSLQADGLEPGGMSRYDAKAAIISDIRELIEEMNLSRENIANFAQEYFRTRCDRPLGV